MARPKVKAVRSFAMRIETLAELRAISEECGVPGAASVIVQNAVESWCRKYRADPKGWLAERGLAVISAPASDDI